MRLGINIDHVATIREARGGLEPDPVTAAHIAEFAGAEAIVCHLREDRRHINDRDVRLLRETVKTKLDLEMAATEEIISIALDIIPDLVTLVPEKRQELTTESGLDIIGNRKTLQTAIQRFHKKDIPVVSSLTPLTSTSGLLMRLMRILLKSIRANTPTQGPYRKHLNSLKRYGTVRNSHVHWTSE